ncbi:MAG: type II 3-dehydroquinate dehydratase [Myxococcales bacterium]|nr:type II 3-dehydroquinate dehydratase [Polyangiaceae bacterium]MDW8249438.1 type II 3-dehydroquinate dehydratase [Myxococcales bacterium]
MSPPWRVLVVSGPNLQLLGQREPALYGTTTLAEIHARLQRIAAEAQTEIDARQSNHEGDLITWIGEAAQHRFSGVILNPGGYTHTSVALLDAIRACHLPVVEVHLSNPDAREPFRRRSYTARGCLGRVAGFGPYSYELALRGLLLHLSDEIQSGRHEG